jgi:hypothetical protein
MLRTVAFETGAETGARVLYHVGIQISGDTLLRVMRRTAEVNHPEPRVVRRRLGVQKSKTYGTIVVDLERHR